MIEILIALAIGLGIGGLICWFGSVPECERVDLGYNCRGKDCESCYWDNDGEKVYVHELASY